MQIARYFLVGGTAAVVDLGIFLPLVYLLDVNYLIAAAASFIVATLVNYFLSIRYVFQSNSRFSKKGEITATYVVSAIGLLLNQLILALAVSQLRFPILPSKIFTMAAVFLWNYYSRKHIVFAQEAKFE